MEQCAWDLIRNVPSCEIIDSTHKDDYENEIFALVPVLACEPASFWLENVTVGVILLRVLERIS